MDMAKNRLAQMAQHGKLLDRYGCRIQMLGKRELVRPDVLEALDKAVELTKGNTKYAIRRIASHKTDKLQGRTQHLRSLHGSG